MAVSGPSYGFSGQCQGPAKCVIKNLFAQSVGPDPVPGTNAAATYNGGLFVPTSSLNSNSGTGAGIFVAATNGAPSNYAQIWAQANGTPVAFMDGSAGLSLGIDGTLAGSMILSNGSSAAHTIWGSAATTNNSIFGFPTAPNNGNLIECVTFGTACTLTDSGIFGGSVVTSSGGASAGKQICTSGGANVTCVYIDFPERTQYQSATCNNATATALWSIGSGGTVACRAGTNNQGGYISITDTSSTFAQFQVSIPADWDTGSNPYLAFGLFAATDTTSGDTIIPKIAVSCPTATNGTVTDDHAFAAAHSAATVTIGASAVANGFYTTSMQANSTDMTGCVAGGMMIVRVGRATDTATGTVGFQYVNVTWPRLLTLQAN
jgi:hypothetical protein